MPISLNQQHAQTMMREEKFFVNRNCIAVTLFRMRKIVQRHQHITQIVERLREAWQMQQRRVERAACACQITFLLQQHAEVVMRVRHSWFQRDGRAVASLGIVDLRQRKMRETELQRELRIGAISS